MKHEDDAGRMSRRKFMKSVALTGGGAAMAVTVGQASAADQQIDEPVADRQDGYHETQHIRDYYAKADF